MQISEFGVFSTVQAALAQALDNGQGAIQFLSTTCKTEQGHFVVCF